MNDSKEFDLYIDIVVIYSYAYTSTYTCIMNHDTIIKQTSEDFFNKICTSHFIVRVRKGLLKVCVWEGVGDRTELHYFDPHSYGRQRCVFLVLQSCSTGGPGAHSAGFLYHILSATSLDPNSSGAPRAPSAWCGFPYHTRLLLLQLQLQLIRDPELYNSSTRTQSPTQFLEWHVW